MPHPVATVLLDGATLGGAAAVCAAELLADPRRPLMVGIGGDSGSGKSHLTGHLSAALTAAGEPHTLLNHDEFLIARADREPLKSQRYTAGPFAGRTRWEVLENYFRLAEFRRVLAELRAGRPAAFRPYQRATGAIAARPRIAEPRPLILVDTSVLLAVMDLVILVDARQETIIARKIARDRDLRTPAEVAQLHRRVQGRYWLERGRPASAPALIVDNDDITAVRVLRPTGPR